MSSASRGGAFALGMRLEGGLEIRACSRWSAVLALVLLALTGCGQWRDLAAPRAPDLSAEWRDLLQELRAFERRLGFRETTNFASLTDERDNYPYCGWASTHLLPYSYEDPAIRWLESITEEQCRDAGVETDSYFGAVEVWGEIGTPVTPAMISGELDRFVYLVIHEDCHDQFELPYGIEEALCNIVTYRAMSMFASEKFRWYSRENRAIRNYALVQSRQTRTTVAHYGELERLYARYYRKEMPLDALLLSRAAVFSRLERALELPAGEINNISTASYMTYSRHYAHLESVFDRLGPDLAHAVDFFRGIDARKPTPAQVMQRHSIAERKSVEFVRAYEQGVIDTIEHTLGSRRVALEP